MRDAELITAPSTTAKPVPSDVRKLRILQMCAVDFTVKQFLVPLVRALEHERHIVTVACSRGPYFDSLKSSGIRMIENPVSRSMNVFSHVAAIYRTWKLLRKARFEVVHVHTPIAALVGRIAARMAGVPVKIYTAHGFYFHDNMPALKRLIYVWMEKIGAMCGDYIMTVSAEDEESAIRLGIARSHEVETIYNGVDTERFSPTRFTPEERADFRAKWEIPGGAPIVGIVGRLVREKGFFEFFEAASIVLKEFPATRFVVVGDVLPSDYDAGKSGFQERIRELGIAPNVVFTGMVDDTAEPLSLMDIFCLPSYREGMPVSLLEAMSMGLACVATDIRGCREEIVDGESGWLVPPRNAEALAEKILWYLRNPAEARSMGDQARSRVLQMFDLQKVLRHQVIIYNRLTAHLRD